MVRSGGFGGTGLRDEMVDILGDVGGVVNRLTEAIAADDKTKAPEILKDTFGLLFRTLTMKGREASPRITEI